MIEIQICGNCKYNRYCYENSGFTCACDESDNYGLETFYDEVCDCWVGKTERDD